MNNRKILIVYNRDVPEDTIVAFQANCLENKLAGSVALRKEEQQFFNFDGAIHDILIYIQQHPTELVAGGLLVDWVNDIFKLVVKTLWEKLRAKAVKPALNKEKLPHKERQVTIRVGDGQRYMEITLDSACDNIAAKELTESLHRLLQSPRFMQLFNNSDSNQGGIDKPRIKVVFNPQTKQWQAVNYEQLRQRFNALRDEATTKWDN